MQTKVYLSGVVLLFTLCSNPSLQAQGFEWIRAYEQITPGVGGEDVKVSASGKIYSQFYYYDNPPFQFDSGTVLERYDSAGNRIWRHIWDGKGSSLHIRVSCHEDDNLFILHSMRRYPNYEANVSKRSPASKLLWDTTFTGRYENIAVARDRINLIGFRPDAGDPRVGHGFSITQIDTLRHILWERDSVLDQNTLFLNPVAYTDRDGNIYITGTVERDERDVFFVKYDINGNLICGRWVHGPAGESERGIGITADRAGYFYLLSTVDGKDNINSACITKYDPIGNPVWSKVMATEVNLGLQSIHYKSDDYIAVGGGYGSEIPLLFIVDSSGVFQWRIPTDARFRFWPMAIGPDGAFYFGNFRGGLAKYSLHPVSVESPAHPPGIPSSCLLKQNYPNPFNPSTAIEFSVPRSSQVRLSVFSPLGQEIIVLADGVFQAGAHTFRFDAEGHPPGMYLYRLNWNGTSIARRMLLSR